MWKNRVIFFYQVLICLYTCINLKVTYTQHRSGDFVIDINHSKGKLLIIRVEADFVYKFDINLVKLLRLLAPDSSVSRASD